MSDSSSHDVFVGMGGWDLPPFDNVFYPRNPERGFRKLAYYAQYFDAVEVNVTFYNVALAPAQVRRWLQDVNPNRRFQFTVKLYRGFTHTFDATARDMTAFRRLLEPLRAAGRLSGIVMQFPGSFAQTKERQEYLTKLAEAFGEDPVFLELRHRSWDGKEVQERIQEKGLCLVNVDLPRLPQHREFQKHVLRGMAYFRMMGRNAETWNNPERGDRYLYHYSETELNDLLERIRSASAQKTFVVFHNDPQAHSPVNGFQLRHLLKPMEKLMIPANLIEAFPQLSAIGEPPKTEGTLFG